MPSCSEAMGLLQPAMSEMKRIQLLLSNIQIIFSNCTSKRKKNARRETCKAAFSVLSASLIFLLVDTSPIRAAEKINHHPNIKISFQSIPNLPDFFMNDLIFESEPVRRCQC